MPIAFLARERSRPFRALWASRPLAALAAVLVVAAWAYAAPQADSEETRGEIRLTEEVEVSIVQFSILARDDRNNPITDLRPEDLRVKVDGEEVPIAFLEPAYRFRALDSPLPQVTLRLELGTMARNSVVEPAPPSHYVFFIDTEPRIAQGPVSEADALTRFIQDKLRAQDLAAVVSFGTDLRVESEFTADRARLADAVANAYTTGRPGRTSAVANTQWLVKQMELCIEDRDTDTFIPGDIEPVLAGAGNNEPDIQCLTDMALLYQEQYAPEIRRYLAALEATVRLAKSVNGNIEVYALSHGVPAYPQIALAEAARAVFGYNYKVDSVVHQHALGPGQEGVIERAMELARRENVSFHFIDPTSPPAGVRSARLKGVYQGGVRPMQVAHESAQGLPRLAALETGGTFLEESNVADGLERTFDLKRGRYTLGIDAKQFESAEGEELDLSVKSRRPGVLIDYSRGLYMQGRSDESTIAGRIALPSAGGADRKGQDVEVPFAIGIDAVDLDYLEEGGTQSSHLTLHLQVQTMDGRDLVGLFHYLKHAQAVTADRPKVVAIEGSLVAPPGAYRLVAFVHNPRTGKNGTFFRELVVPESPTKATRAAPN